MNKAILKNSQSEWKTMEDKSNKRDFALEFDKNYKYLNQSVAK